MQIWISDVETAGFKKPEKPASGIVQVGAIRIESVNGLFVEKERISSYINPGCDIDKGAFEVHGIGFEQVCDAPTIEEVYNIKGPSFFIAHNKAFDYRWLGDQIENCVGGLCTLVAARRYLPEAPDKKLTTLIQHYGLQKLDAHDAVNDCLMTLSILNLMIERTQMTLEQMASALNKPKPVTEMPFGKHKGKPIKSLPKDYIKYMLNLEDLDQDVRRGMVNELKMRGEV